MKHFLWKNLEQLFERIWNNRSQSERKQTEKKLVVSGWWPPKNLPDDWSPHLFILFPFIFPAFCQRRHPIEDFDWLFVPVFAAGIVFCEIIKSGKLWLLKNPAFHSCLLFLREKSFGEDCKQGQACSSLSDKRWHYMYLFKLLNLFVLIRKWYLLNFFNEFVILYFRL